MRLLGVLVAGSLGLLAAACGSGSLRTDPVTPVGKYKELLPGKWDAEAANQLVQKYEFGPDNQFQMAVKGMAGPVKGTFAWTGDRELELEYQASGPEKKEYAAAVKAYKEPMQKQVEGGKGGGPIGAAIMKSLEAIPDELPAKDKVKVILGEKPRELLIVTLEGGLTLNFNRAK